MIVRKGTLSVVALAGLVIGSAGCNVDYRHEVEAEGTAPSYTFGAGGFVRYDGYTNEKGKEIAGDLQIASVDYRKPGSEITVRLTGVIHIGDIDYYKTLQREALDTADVVLFEGVKFEGEPEQPKRQDDGNALGDMYSTMGELLGTGFQKDGINYQAKNFVHCDVTVKRDDPLTQVVSPGQMQQSMGMMGPLLTFKDMLLQGKDVVRNEDGMKHQMAKIMIAQMSGASEEDILKDLQGKQGGLPPMLRGQAERAAKRLKGSPLMPGFGMSPEMQKQIIDRRDEYVIDQLRIRLEKEDHANAQTIAVFYGAGHLPGMSARLAKMGFEPVKTTWFRAWAMNGRKAGHVVETVGTGPETQPLVPARPVTPGELEKKTQPKKRVLY